MITSYDFIYDNNYYIIFTIIFISLIIRFFSINNLNNNISIILIIIFLYLMKNQITNDYLTDNKKDLFINYFNLDYEKNNLKYLFNNTKLCYFYLDNKDLYNYNNYAYKTSIIYSNKLLEFYLKLFNKKNITIYDNKYIDYYKNSLNNFQSIIYSIKKQDDNDFTEKYNELQNILQNIVYKIKKRIDNKMKNKDQDINTFTKFNSDDNLHNDIINKNNFDFV